MSAAPGVRAFVAFGSNLGDREAHLLAAIAALRATPGVGRVRLSPIFETDPVGPPGQGAYLNAVAELETGLAPHALLARLLEIERAAGRARSGVRDEARPLDLDLLLHGERTVDEPDLQVPHPRLHERAFVLEPLAALAPGLAHPTLGVPVAELAARVRDPQAVRPYVPGARLAAAREGHMAIVAVSISPVGAGASVGPYVAEALRVLRGQDRVHVEPGSMFTTLEGDLDEVLALVRAMQEAVFAKGAVRVSTVLKIDERRDRPARMADKLATARAALERDD